MPRNATFYMSFLQNFATCFLTFVVGWGYYDGTMMVHALIVIPMRQCSIELVQVDESYASSKMTFFWQHV